MKFSILGFSCLVIISGCLISCRHTFSPIREYRLSKTYRQNLEISLSQRDTIFVEQLFIASGLLTKTNLDQRIPINQNLIFEGVVNRLERISDITFSVLDSAEPIFVDRFAFNDPWNRKINFGKFDYYNKSGFRLLPYVEFSVRTRLETEGGGGIESSVRTGNRIHNMRQGVVLTMFCEGEQVFSSGHYITDQFKDHKDSVTVYDLPVERLDSLMALCLADLEKEIEANKYRLK